MTSRLGTGKPLAFSYSVAAFVFVPSVFRENISTAEFGIIGIISAETACWDIERKIAKFFYEDFLLPLYLPLCCTVSLLYPLTPGYFESEYSRMDSKKKRNPSAGGGISEPSSGDGILECDLGEM
jgi:hypothetical protein